MKKLLLSSMLFSGFACFAQSGTNVYTFMNIPVSAQQSALGGNAVSERDDDDISMLLANPSLLHADMSGKIALNAATYLAGSTYGTLAYAKDLEEGHLIMAGVRYMNYGKMPRADESGEVNGEFSASDAAIGVGYAYQFEDEWTVGANLNFITSKIDTYGSTAVAANAGVTWHRSKTGQTAAMVFRNFGYQLKSYNGDRERMPYAVDLGYTQKLKKFPASLTLTAHDLQQFDISSEYNSNGQEVKLPRKLLDHLSFGAEFFPDKNFNLRLGYNIKRGNELAVVDQRSFAGISAGFSFRISSFRFDYTHSRYHNAGNLNQLGIMIDLTGKRN